MFLGQLFSLAGCFVQLVNPTWLREEQWILTRQEFTGEITMLVGVFQATQERSPPLPVVWRFVMLVHCVPLAEDPEHRPLDNCLRVQCILSFDAAPRERENGPLRHFFARDPQGGVDLPGDVSFRALRSP